MQEPRAKHAHADISARFAPSARGTLHPATRVPVSHAAARSP
jgi:hypothetical protein